MLHNTQNFFENSFCVNDGGLGVWFIYDVHFFLPINVFIYSTYIWDFFMWALIGFYPVPGVAVMYFNYHVLVPPVGGPWIL